MLKQRQQVVRGTVCSEHVVQLFDSPESLGEAVAAFLRAGLEARGPLLVVAKASNVRQIAKALERAGLSMSSLVDQDRLTILDAHSTLRAILRNGSLDARLFDARVGDVVVRLAADGGPLHIYGELVELFAEEANFHAAIELEELWNQLGAMVPFSLLCGYSSPHFAAPYAGAALRHICDRHTRVHQSNGDILGNWLLRGRSETAGAAPDVSQPS